MSYVDELSDAIDEAIGNCGGFIVVQTENQRALTVRALSRLLPKQPHADLEEKIQVRIVPEAKSPHFRREMPGE